MAKNQVIIIGGGISGLAAANELINSGITKIVILEAQNRLGGRILTLPAEDGSHVIELGAQWIHGQKKNPVFDLCSEIGIVDKKTKTVVGDNMYYACQNGKKIDDDDVEAILDQIENIFDKIEDEAEEMEETEDKPLKEMIDLQFNTLLNKLRSEKKLKNDKVEIIRAILNERLKEEMVDTACEDLNNLSVIGWNEYVECEGDEFTNLKFGYGQLIQHLSSKIPPENILSNEVVTKIEWPDETGHETFDDHVVVVTTVNQKDQTESTHYGLQCICTMSLGCLKESHSKLFEPKLPPPKIKAIENLGFGVVNKLFLVFDNPLFQEDMQGLQILWRNDFELELQSVKKWNLKNPTFYKSFTSFEVLPKKRNIIYTFICGKDAQYIEELENPCLVEVLHEMLVKCFTKMIIPKPLALIKSAWSSNKFVRGSYTYIKTQSSIEDMKNLATPICSKVHFAGESTDYKFHSTVHGAFRSGVRAARDAIKILNKKK